MKKNNFYFIVAVLVMFSYNQVFSQQKTYDIKITVPEKDGVQVGKSKEIKGTASIPDGEFLWVLVHRVDGFIYVWWPQGEAEINPETKEWELTVNFGQEQDIGFEFEIAVITVDSREHSVLENYLVNAMTSGDWRPIKMPPTQTAPIFRKQLMKVE